MKKIISFLIVWILSLSLMCSVCYAGYSEVKEPMYNMADSFYSNITKISQNSMWAICDTNGYPLTGYKWEAMGEITDHYIPAKQGGLWGYISPEGKTIIPYRYQQADNFSEGIARVLTQDNRYAYINQSGETVFVSPYDYSFGVSDGAICVVQDGFYGYCDTGGSIIIYPQFEMGLDFHGGFAAVKFGGKWGYISTEGTYVVKPAYTHAGDFENGYAVCSTSSGYGIIDRQGKKVSSFNFSYIGKMDSAGRFPAKAGSKCGYINAQGQWQLTVNYDFCYTFNDGVARVYKNGLWGYINEHGEEIVSPVFADCGDYRNGRALYSLDGMTYGFLTLDMRTDTAVPVAPPTTTPSVSEKPVNTTPTPQYSSPSEPIEENAIIIDFSRNDSLPAPVYQNNSISMKIGNNIARKMLGVKELSHAPVLLDGVTMVPLRDVVEYMGGKVEWNEQDKKISISLNGCWASMALGSKMGYVNGIATAFPAAPDLVDGVTMIPVRGLAMALNCKIEWTAQNQNIFITY